MRGGEERPVQLSRVSKGRGTVQGGSWGEVHSQDIVTNALEASEGVLSRDGSSTWKSSACPQQGGEWHMGAMWKLKGDRARGQSRGPLQNCC